MRALGIAMLLGLLSLAAARPANAHPHVFIDYSMEPVVRDGAIVGVRMQWRFDDLYSGLILDSVDTDGDGRLSDAEIAAIASRTLKNIEQQGFYTRFLLDGVEWQAERSEAFTARTDGDHIVYVFTLALPAPTRAVVASAYDPEYYIEMLADKEQPAAPHDKVGCAISRGAPVATGAWGNFTPDLITCSVSGR